MQPFRLVAAVGAILFLLSAVMPWLTVNVPIIGQFSLTMADTYRFIAQQMQPQPKLENPAEQVGRMVGSMLPILFSIILFPISALLGIASILARQAALAAGLLAILTGILWIAGIESLKSQIVEQASLGGVLGKQLASLLAAVIQIGYGVYVAIIAGIIMLIASSIKAGGTSKHRSVSDQDTPLP
jgi:low temperature requirement protein LtrA